MNLMHLTSALPSRRALGILALNVPLMGQLLHAGAIAYISLCSQAAGVATFYVDRTLGIAGYAPISSPQIAGPESIDSIVVAEAAKNRLNPSLIRAVIHVESRGQVFAISKVGAAGLMQLMPATAAHYGVSPNDRGDPHKNISAGAAHLGSLLKRFHGDLPRSLQVYNGGDSCWNRCHESIEYADAVIDLMAQESSGRG